MTEKNALYVFIYSLRKRRREQQVLLKKYFIKQNKSSQYKK